MADLKISELTNLTAADPANDMIPIVDVSATPPASGSTKRISINNILACSPTATLASATISGDLTVRTNKLKVDSTGVAVGATSAAYLLDVRGTDTTFGFFSGLTKAVRFVGSASTSKIEGVDNTNASYQPLSIGGSALDFSLSGSTAMTLNANGLGVGTSPAVLLDVQSASAVIRATSSTGTNTSFAAFANTGGAVRVGAENSAGGGLFTGSSAYSAVLGTTGAYSAHIGTSGAVRMTVDSTGNVGIGVASPTSQLTVGSGGTANPAATVAFHKSTSDEYRLKLTSSTFNAAGKWIGLGLGYSSDYMKMAIIAEAKDTNARGNLYFALNNDATSANASIADAKMTLKSTGQVRFVPLASDPSGAEAGDVYYNSTSNKLKCYNGTTWNDLF